MEVKCHEGKTVCKADLRKVQDHSPQGPRNGYLPEPEAQAEAGLICFGGAFAPQSANLVVHTEPTSTWGVPHGAAGAEAASILVSDTRLSDKLWRYRFLWHVLPVLTFPVKSA